jgi:Methyltransferase FkbM domain
LPWMRHPKPLSHLKLLVVPAGKRQRTVVTGAFRGLRMQLDLRDQTQLFLGLHERELYQGLWRIAPAVRSAIDVGAAEGEYTLFFLSKTRAEMVLAVEPSEPLCSILMRNVVANGVDIRRLEVCRYLLGEYDTDSERRLDSVAGSLRFPAVIKIDVDGAEAAVLRGAPDLLRRRDVHWLVETHTKTLEEDCLNIFDAAGLRSRIVRNAWWRVIVPENRPVAHNRWLIAGPSAP